MLFVYFSSFKTERQDPENHRTLPAGRSGRDAGQRHSGPPPRAGCGEKFHDIRRHESAWTGRVSNRKDAHGCIRHGGRIISLFFFLYIILKSQKIGNFFDAIVFFLFCRYHCFFFSFLADITQ